MAELDEATQKVVEDFDALAKQRCAELLGDSSAELPHRAALERAFCLGYKAGAVDTNVAAKQAQHLLKERAMLDVKIPVQTERLDQNVISPVTPMTVRKYDGGDVEFDLDVPSLDAPQWSNARRVRIHLNGVAAVRSLREIL